MKKKPRKVWVTRRKHGKPLERGLQLPDRNSGGCDIHVQREVLTSKSGERISILGAKVIKNFHIILEKAEKYLTIESTLHGMDLAYFGSASDMK